MSDHRRNDRLSLAYHRAIAQRLAQDGNILSRARARVDGWARDGSVHVDYVAAWRRVLEGDARAVAAFLTDGGEHAMALRQVSPFGGVLSPRERWAIWRAYRGEVDDPRAA
jgi:antirestriction protein ArdC